MSPQKIISMKFVIFDLKKIILEFAFENIVCETSAILYWPLYVYVLSNDKKHDDMLHILSGVSISITYVNMCLYNLPSCNIIWCGDRHGYEILTVG